MLHSGSDQRQWQSWYSPYNSSKKGHYQYFEAFFSPLTSTQGELKGHVVYQFPTLGIQKSNQVNKCFWSVKHQQPRTFHNIPWKENTDVGLRSSLFHLTGSDHLLLAPAGRYCKDGRTPWQNQALTSPVGSPVSAGAPEAVPVLYSDLCCQNNHIDFLVPMVLTPTYFLQFCHYQR